LDTWLEAAKSSGVSDLRQFALSLERDYAAAKAALDLPYSNAQLEGQINRLKLIKRSAYGRAKFDLLRLRVLHAARSVITQSDDEPFTRATIDNNEAPARAHAQRVPHARDVGGRAACRVLAVALCGEGMVMTGRLSARLARLAADVWRALPASDRAALAARNCWMVQAPIAAMPGRLADAGADGVIRLRADLPDGEWGVISSITN
jgi:hypothetical protein